MISIPASRARAQASDRNKGQPTAPHPKWHPLPSTKLRRPKGCPYHCHQFLTLTPTNEKPVFMVLNAPSFWLL